MTGIISGLAQHPDIEGLDNLRIGTTVATNALLERRGARTALLTTAGFGDVLAIGRQNRPLLYRLHQERPPALVDDAHRLEIDERLDQTGAVLTPLDEGALSPLANSLAADTIESLAIVFLFSYRNPAHERQAADVIRKAYPDMPVELSCETWPQAREYERAVLSTINAYVRPAIEGYLDRLIAGIGHGVQDWMEQIGARTPSPLTTLEEVLTAVRRLLRGEEVSVEGREVQLRGVRLEAPPVDVPPVVAGVRGPKSMAVAGRSCDGVILVEGAGPAAARAARRLAGDPEGWRVSTFTSLCIAPSREQAYEWMAPLVAGWVRSANPTVGEHPHFAEMQALLADGGEAALAGMPRDWWLDLAAVGTFDDAVEHVQRLGEASVQDVAIFPPEELDIAHGMIDDVIALRRAV